MRVNLPAARAGSTLWVPSSSRAGGTSAGAGAGAGSSGGSGSSAATGKQAGRSIDLVRYIQSLSTSHLEAVSGWLLISGQG